MPLHWQGDHLLLTCRIQPRASRNEFAGLLDGALKIRITAAPVDGEANRHLVRFLAKAFGVPQQHVRIIRGEQGRHKTVSIESPQQYPEGVSIPPH